MTEAVAVGLSISAFCEISEIDRHRLAFATTVTAGERLAPQGTNQCFIVGG